MGAQSQDHSGERKAAVVCELIAEQLSRNADAPFAVMPGKESHSQPTKVTFRGYAAATSRFARAVQARDDMPRTGVIALLIHCDTLLYATALSGVIAAGYTVFPISNRNSPEAIAHLIRTVSAHRLLVTSSTLGSLVDEVGSLFSAEGSHEVQIDELPLFYDIYPAFDRESPRSGHHHQESDPLVVPLPSRDVFKDGVEMYLHSSGSTGYPKAIPYTHEVIASHAQFTWVSEIIDRGRSMILGGLSVPTFHAMGMLFHLLYPLMTGCATAMYAPCFPKPPVVTSPDVALQGLRKVEANIVFVVPAFLETWCHDTAAMDYLRTADIISFAGGPLAPAAKVRLLEGGCKVTSIYGGTEFGPVTKLFSSHPTVSKDDQYTWCEFSTNVLPRWRADGADTYELELLATPCHVLAKENLLDVRGYATRDLWKPHPTIKGLWRIVARVDDVIVLSSGEKIVPGPMEAKILGNSMVKSVIMFGHGRRQAGLLIDPRLFSPKADYNTLKHCLWPCIEEANRIMPGFARVHPETVMLVDPNKPLPLSPKGTVLRKSALALYDAEIERLYSQLEHDGDVAEQSGPRSWSQADILSWVVGIATTLLGRDVNPDICLFDQGFDSLSATMLRNRILGAVRQTQCNVKDKAVLAISTNIGYATSSPKQVSFALVELIESGRSLFQNTSEADILRTVNKYTKTMIPVIHKRLRASETAVLITGTTGNLGSHILDQCLRDPSITRVYALNRRKSTQPIIHHKQTRSFEKRMLDTEILNSPKLTYIEYSSGMPKLGLDDCTYEMLRSTVTVILHNAWRLDFTLPLSAFEPHLASTKDLLDLAESARFAVRFVLVSSVSTARAWSLGNGPVPENYLDDPRVCLGYGYAESKYVAEQMVKHRQSQSENEYVTLRVGQIAGSEQTGAWSPRDWIPIIIKSGVSIGHLPAANGAVSWLPMDVVVSSVMNVACKVSSPPAVMNIVHPLPVSWRTIFEYVSAAAKELCVTQLALPLVSCSQWLGLLSTERCTEEHMRDVPALKLIGFLEELASVEDSSRRDVEAGGYALFDTAVAASCSSSLASASPLNEQHVKEWMTYWQAQGVF